MSYILDALRKSEQQRQQGAAPRLLAAHAAVEERTQYAFFAYGLALAVLVGVGALIGWLRPWQGAARPAAPAAVPEAGPGPSVAVLPAVPPRVDPGAEQGHSAQKSLVALKSVPAPEVAIPEDDTRSLAGRPPAPAAPARTPGPRKAAPRPEAAPSRPAAAPRPEKVSAPAGEEAADGVPTDPAREPQVISMAELPPAIRQEIPAISIPVHTYSSTPAERIVGINDRLLQEGDYLAPGLKVEEIAPDGVIFRYKDYRFRHGL